LKIIGKKGYGLLLQHARESTNYLREILDHCGNFEVLNTPELFILNYRFIPEAAKEQISIWEGVSEYLPSSLSNKEKAREAEEKIRDINRLINGLNVKLHRELRRDDTTFVSRTTLESTRYRPQNIVVLRAVLINPLTDEKVLDEIVETQNRIGLRIWREFESAFKRIKEESP
jgi:glutamate decarboxylase